MMAQEAFIDASGVPGGTYKKIERGERHIEFDELWMIAQAFGITVAELVSTAEENAEENAALYSVDGRVNPQQISAAPTDIELSDLETQIPAALEDSPGQG